MLCRLRNCPMASTWMGGGCIFIYSCSARRVSFEIKSKLINLKRNLSWKTWKYEYTPPPHLRPCELLDMRESDNVFILNSKNFQWIFFHAQSVGNKPPKNAIFVYLTKESNVYSFVLDLWYQYDGRDVM